MIYTGMLIAGITAGYICLERHRPVEGILLLTGIAGSFAAISEQMGKEYGMTRKQLRVMLLFLMVGFFNFALNYNRYYTVITVNIRLCAMLLMNWEWESLDLISRKTFMINKGMRYNESCFAVCQGTKALYEK